MTVNSSATVLRTQITCFFFVLGGGGGRARRRPRPTIVRQPHLWSAATRYYLQKVAPPLPTEPALEGAASASEPLQRSVQNKDAITAVPHQTSALLGPFRSVASYCKQSPFFFSPQQEDPVRKRGVGRGLLDKEAKKSFPLSGMRQGGEGKGPIHPLASPPDPRCMRGPSREE